MAAEPTKSRTRGTGKAYVRTEDFPTKDDFEAYLKQQKPGWAKGNLQYTKEGVKRNYRCKFRGCQYKCYVLYCADSYVVELYEEEGTRHIHNDVVYANVLTPETKKKILTMHGAGTAPRAITRKLSEKAVKTTNYKRNRES